MTRIIPEYTILRNSLRHPRQILGYTKFRNSRQHPRQVPSKGASPPAIAVPDPRAQAIEQAYREGVAEGAETFRTIAHAANVAGVDPQVALELQERHGTEKALELINAHPGEWAGPRTAFDLLAERYYEGASEIP